MWSKKLQSVSATLTFDPDGYCVLDVSDLIGSSASVFTHIIKGRLLDLNHLVEVLYFNARRCPQVVTVLGPCNTRSRPWWWETRLYTGALSWNQSQRYIKEKRLTEWIFLTATLIFYKKKRSSVTKYLVILRWRLHSCSDALQEQLLPLQDQYGAGRACGRQPGGGSLGHRANCRENKPKPVHSQTPSDQTSWPVKSERTPTPQLEYRRKLNVLVYSNKYCKKNKS